MSSSEGYTRKAYEDTEKKLVSAEERRDEIAGQYAEDIAMHEQLKEEQSSSDQPYSFEDEYRGLKDALTIETEPLDKEIRGLTARLNRLYRLAENEARAENRYRDNIEALHHIKEIHTYLNRFRDEIKKRFVEVIEMIDDLDAAATELEDLLSKEEITSEEEGRIKELGATLEEGCALLLEKKQEYVHNDRLHRKPPKPRQ